MAQAPGDSAGAQTPGDDEPATDGVPGRQRLDRWIWHARVVRSRADAADLIRAGHVRLDGTRVTTPAQAVRAGQVLTIALDARVRVLRVLSFSERRGDATSTVALFDEITDN
ncbi:RNA-binding S4 domain-containing protein [Xanthobacter agilis]|uniref:RNA-binding S4 domain-containing protein n=1 Tax=Xanthobacter agilis TaxID=47492 RepID=UPI00372B7B74